MTHEKTKMENRQNANADNGKLYEREGAFFIHENVERILRRLELLKKGMEQIRLYREKGLGDWQDGANLAHMNIDLCLASCYQILPEIYHDKIRYDHFRELFRKSHEENFINGTEVLVNADKKDVNFIPDDFDAIEYCYEFLKIASERMNKYCIYVYINTEKYNELADEMLLETIASLQRFEYIFYDCLGFFKVANREDVRSENVA